jgi:hypothetical protein
MIEFKVGKVGWAFLIVVEVEPSRVPIDIVRKVWPFLIAILGGPLCDGFSSTNLFNEVSGGAINRAIFPFKKKIGIVYIRIIKC